MNKKFIAIITALALVVTLLAPVGVQEASAASTNSVDRILNVSDSKEFTVGDVVYLRIEEKNAGEFGSSESFRLTLENAKFESAHVSAIETGISGDGTGTSVTSLGERSIQVQLDTTVGGPSKKVYQIPLYSKVTDNGDVTVTVEPLNSRVSGGTYTYAIASGGATVTTIGKVETFAGSVVLSNLVIDETRSGSLDSNQVQDIKLRLPSGFEWDNGSGAKSITLSAINLNVTTGGLLVGNVEPSSSNTDANMDERDLDLRIKIDGSNSARGTIIIEGLRVKATSSAKFGDVTLSVRGNKVTDQELVIAKYADYGVTAKADGDPKEIFAGRWDNNSTTGAAITSSDEHKLQKLVIEETTAGAWLAERRTRIEFPNGVKIVGVTATVNNGDSSSQFELGNLESSRTGKNFVEYTDLTLNNSSKSKVELTFYVSVAANFTGDITAIVTGNAIGNEEHEVVLGNAIAPVTVEADSADLRVGVNNQAIGEITITESKKESLEKGKDLVVYLGRATDGINWSSTPTIEIVEGDIELDLKAVSRSGRALIIPVKSESSKASTIKITDAKADLNRIVAEGKFNVAVGGSAVVQNHAPNLQDNGLFDQSTVAAISALTVVTPAPGETRATVQFGIDSTTYTVDGKEMTMDVAPYIKDSRTFLPVFFVAQSLGVHENNIIWEPHTKTVTIIKGDRVAQMQIGNKTLTVNGTAILMDTAPEIKDGRTMLPIFFVGQALGAQVSWDGDTRTVTVQQ